MKFICVLILLTSNLAFATDSGLGDAIEHSNIKRLNPRPHIRMKGSFSYKEAIVCDVNPLSESLLVTINPNQWYALDPAAQINAFCAEMHKCDERIECKKL